MKITKVLLVGLIAPFIFISCGSDDDSNIEEQATGVFDNGVLVSHEGGFSASGSTSFLTNDLETVQNGIFTAVNGIEPGSFQQSIGFNGEDAFIVTDNLDKITKVNRFTFESEVEITEGLDHPRYIEFNDNMGYVSNWGDTGVDTDDFIAVIDLDLNEVELTIPVGLGPEQLAIANDKLYVSHKGAFGTNNIISVIDLSTNEILSEIEVGDNPDELIVIGDELWIAVEGGQPWQTVGETVSSIVVINTITDTVTKTLEIELTNHVTLFDYDSGSFYYTVGSDVYELSTDADVLPSEVLTSAGFSIYGMSVNDGVVYATDAGDFASNGFLSTYDIESSIWSEAIALGLVPAKVYFNN